MSNSASHQQPLYEEKILDTWLIYGIRADLSLIDIRYAFNTCTQDCVYTRLEAQVHCKLIRLTWSLSYSLNPWPSVCVYVCVSLSCSIACLLMPLTPSWQAEIT